MKRIICFIMVSFLVSACGSLDNTSSGGSSGNGTVMNCSPPTGCAPPTSWYGGGYCYATSNDCHNAGNSNCRQCY